MEKRFRDSSMRHPKHDYGSQCHYHVTICTREMKKYFGSLSTRTHQDASPGKAEELISGTHPNASVSMQLSSIGIIAQEYWLEIPKHFSFVELDEFIIMPNHLHGILYFNVPDNGNWTPNEFKARSNTLGSVLRQYKGAVKRYANLNNIEFEWKPRYHDRIIRTKMDLENVRKYIVENR